MSALLYADGNFAELDAIPAPDHGLLFGAGFFETFRTRGGEPVRLASHLARLHAACDRLGVRLPQAALAASADSARWRAVIARLLESHGLSDGVFRLTVTAGPNTAPPGGGVYDSPHESLVCRAPSPAPPEEGISLWILDTRRDTGEWRPRPKSLNYLNSLLAARELAPLRRHPADEGLMLDAAGRVCEGVFSNLVWVRDGVVFTPHEDTGCLPGIGRAHLLAGLRAAGVRVEEVSEGIDGLTQADAVATVSCVRGVVPVSRIVGRDGESYWESGNKTGAALEGLRRAFEG